MKKLFILTVIAFQLLSCNSKKNQEENKIIAVDSVNTEAQRDSVNAILVFEGILPCADCSGIETVLKIDHGNGTIENYQFELSRVYQGKLPKKVFTEKGSFNTERGLEDDPNGTIYVLNWDKSIDQQIYYGYYSDNPKKIYLLDRDKKIIESKLNYSLELKK